ncbi:hypothetical protein DIPPA_70043 [Diplonema papillatum]|nr:hypothetical protein DIPPA_70043 [Diplonema papillatum]
MLRRSFRLCEQLSLQWKEAFERLPSGVQREVRLKVERLGNLSTDDFLTGNVIESGAFEVANQVLAVICDVPKSAVQALQTHVLKRGHVFFAPEGTTQAIVVQLQDTQNEFRDSEIVKVAEQSVPPGMVLLDSLTSDVLETLFGDAQTTTKFFEAAESGVHVVFAVCPRSRQLRPDTPVDVVWQDFPDAICSSSLQDVILSHLRGLSFTEMATSTGAAAVVRGCNIRGWVLDGVKDVVKQKYATSFQLHSSDTSIGYFVKKGNAVPPEVLCLCTQHAELEWTQPVPDIAPDEALIVRKERSPRIALVGNKDVVDALLKNVFTTDKHFPEVLWGADSLHGDTLQNMLHEVQEAGCAAQAAILAAESENKLSHGQKQLKGIREVAKKLRQLLPALVSTRNALLACWGATVAQVQEGSPIDSPLHLAWALKSIESLVEREMLLLDHMVGSAKGNIIHYDSWEKQLQTAWLSGASAKLWSTSQQAGSIPETEVGALADLFPDLSRAGMHHLLLITDWEIVAKASLDVGSLRVVDTSHLLQFDLPEDPLVYTILPFTTLFELRNLARRSQSSCASLAAERFQKVITRLMHPSTLGSVALIGPFRESQFFLQVQDQVDNLLVSGGRLVNMSVPDDRILLTAFAINRSLRILGKTYDRKVNRSVFLFSEDIELSGRADYLGLAASRPPLLAI